MKLSFSLKTALLVCISLFLLSIKSAFAQTLESKIDSLLGLTFTSDGPGAVFLVAKASNLLIWNEALKNDQLLKPETNTKLFRNYSLKDGGKINYGYGWHASTIRDSPSYEHGGSIFGFKSMGVYLPEQDIYVVGLTNCDCNSPTELTRRIAELAMQDWILGYRG